MSLIVTYRTGFSFNSTASAGCDGGGVARDGLCCQIERDGGGMILSALSDLPDLFFKLLTPLCLMVCRASPAQPSSPASALTFRFSRQIWGPRGQTSQVQPTARTG